MKLMEKILWATDFHQAAVDAKQTAVMLAKKFQSEITLIHVIPELEDISLPRETVIENIKKMLANIRDRISGEGITTPEPILLIGSPFDQITRYADEHNVNIIIMGAGEKSSTQKFQLGITAGQIIRNSRKPVWIVKKGAAPQLKKILCPVDFSDSSERALKNAVHLARQFEAQLTVLHVIKPPSGIYLKMTAVVKEERKKAKEVHVSEFENFLKRFDFHRVKWEKAVEEGNPAEEILAFVSRFQPDLMVMGTVGRTGLDRILIGSVAEKVSRELPCSTILVKSEAPLRLKLEEQMAAIGSFFKQGHELLEAGFAPEAASKFEYCIANDVMFAPAWEGLAAAYARLGREKESQKSLEKANEIRKNLWEKQVELEIRKQRKKR